jgi:hypothetical protein
MSFYCSKLIFLRVLLVERGLKTDRCMNYYKRILIILMSLFLYASCEQKQENAKSMISGSSSKTWKEVKEMNAEGGKTKMTKDEKNEIIQFYADGHFTMKSSNASNEGTWKYDEAVKNLSLTFEGANFSEYFTVLELGKNKMKLKGSDGTTLIMKAWQG